MICRLSCCQLIPGQWAGHSYEKLLDDLYEHTYKVMDLLAKQISLDCRIFQQALLYRKEKGENCYVN